MLRSSLFASLVVSALALPPQLVFNTDASFFDQFDKTGFTLDLADRRLVQFEGREPVWMSEAEKVLGSTGKFLQR